MTDISQDVKELFCLNRAINSLTRLELENYVVITRTIWDKASKGVTVFSSSETKDALELITRALKVLNKRPKYDVCGVDVKEREND